MIYQAKKKKQLNKNRSGFTPLESPAACSGDENKIPFGANTGFKAPCEPRKRPKVLRGEPYRWKVKDFLTGFTFVELMLVIILLAVIVVLAVPRIRSTFTRLEIENFAKKVAALMRYAQSKAIAEGEKIYLGYKEENKARSFFLAKYDSNPSSPADKKLEPIDERYRLSVSDSIKIKTKPPEPPLPGSQGIIFIFNPDSSIKGSETVISNETRKFKITASKGGIGRIKVEELFVE